MVAATLLTGNWYAHDCAHRAGCWWVMSSIQDTAVTPALLVGFRNLKLLEEGPLQAIHWACSTVFYQADAGFTGCEAI